MAIAEHVLVEKGFAFVSMRGPLGDVSTSFHGDKLVITKDVEASISQPEDRTLIENDDAKMSCLKKKRRDVPHVYCSRGCQHFEMKGGRFLFLWPHKRSK